LSQQLQHGAPAKPHSLTTRWLAFVCLLLAGVVGTAQAVHVHGELLPKNDLQAHLPADAGQQLGGEEHCPLCVAMHSTLPVEEAALPGAALLSSTKVVEHQSLAPATRWHFAMFSRPPPSVV